MKNCYIYTEPNQCRPKGFYTSIPQAAEDLKLHPNTIRYQFNKHGFYSGLKGTIMKVERILK